MGRQIEQTDVKISSGSGNSLEESKPGDLDREQGLEGFVGSPRVASEDMTLELRLRCEKEQHENSWLGPRAPESGSIVCRGSELGRLHMW